jgi:hypothetical protein
MRIAYRRKEDYNHRWYFTESLALAMVFCFSGQEGCTQQLLAFSFLTAPPLKMLTIVSTASVYRLADVADSVYSKLIIGDFQDI